MKLLALLVLLLAPPENSFVIENVTVEVGNGLRLPGASVIVHQGRILAVGKDLKASAVIRRIDGQGKVLTPGLIEPWSVLGLREVSQVAATRDYQLEGRAVAPAFNAADGFNPLTVRIPIAREAGITSAIAAPYGKLIYGVGGWFELTGSMDVIPKPAAMYGGVGEGAAAAVGKSRGGVWLRLREVFDDALYLGKNPQGYDQGNARPLTLPRIHLRALFPVLMGKLPLVLVANRASDIRTAMRFARLHSVRLIIAGGAEAWLVAKELAQAKVPVIMTPSYLGPGAFESLRTRDDSAALLAKAGVPLIISGGYWITRLRQEAGMAVAHGLDYQTAIQAITLATARAFGKDSELGSIEKDKRANLVLWSGDPLELSTVAEKVWIDGVEQSLDNRQRQLVRRYQSR